MHGTKSAMLPQEIQRTRQHVTGESRNGTSRVQKEGSNGTFSNVLCCQVKKQCALCKNFINHRRIQVNMFLRNIPHEKESKVK